MGGNVSSGVDQRSTGKARGIMTTQQLLMRISQKVKDLQDTISNMKIQPMADNVARPYLLSVLESAEEELQHLKSSIGRPEAQKRKGQDQYPRLDQDNPHSSQTTWYKNTATHDQLAMLTSTNAEIQKQVEQLTDQNKTNKKIIDDLSKLNQKNKTESFKLQSELERLMAEKRELCLRLSKLSGDKLTADNPNIADLSDPHRPTKLVDMMSELYDNEWTEAFIALQPSKNDEKIIKILLDTFLDVFSFCKSKSTSLVALAEKSAKELFQDFNSTVNEKDSMTKNKSATLLHRNGKEKVDIAREQSFKGWTVVFMDWQNTETETELEQSGGFTNLQDVWTKLDGELKKTRKNIGVALIPIVTKAYLKPRWSKSCVRALKPYIKKCVYVAGMMCIQTPPMSIAPLPRHGDKFDTSLYSPYSKRGESVDFVVWPSVVLKEPQSESEKLRVMKKGVAQGKAV